MHAWSVGSRQSARLQVSVFHSNAAGPLNPATRQGQRDSQARHAACERVKVSMDATQGVHQPVRGRGRPRREIDVEKVQSLLNARSKYSQIGEIFQVGLQLTPTEAGDQQRKLRADIEPHCSAQPKLYPAGSGRQETHFGITFQQISCSK